MLRSRLLRLRVSVVGSTTLPLLAPRPPVADADDDEDIFADLKEEEEEDDDFRKSRHHKPTPPPPDASSFSPTARPSLLSKAPGSRPSLFSTGPSLTGQTYPRPAYLNSSSDITASNRKRSGNHNGSSSAVQGKNGLPYEETTFDDEWRCPACSKANFLNRSSCRSCGTLKPISSGSVSMSSRKPLIQMKFLDDSEDLVLPMYEEETPNHVRGASFVPNSRSETTSRKGDWKCDSCSTLNFARRITCFACAVPKPLLPPTNSADEDPITTRASWKNRSLLARTRAPNATPPPTTEVEDSAFPEDEFYEAQLAAHWVCDDCAMVNGSSRSVCVGCSKHYNKVGTSDDDVISGLGSPSTATSPPSGKKRGRPSNHKQPSSSPPPPTPSRRQLLESILAEEERGDEVRSASKSAHQFRGEGEVEDVFGDSLWADEGGGVDSSSDNYPSRPVEHSIVKSPTGTTPRGSKKNNNATSPPQTIGGKTIVDLDWACPACRYTNFRARTTCRQCNELKPTEITRVQRRVAEEAGLKFRGSALSSSSSLSANVKVPNSFNVDGNATSVVVDRSLSVPSTAPPNCQRFFKDRNPREPLTLFAYNTSTKTNAKDKEGLRSVVAGRSVASYLLGAIPLHKRFGDPSTGHFDLLLMSPHPKPHRLNLGDWQCGCGVINRASRPECMGCNTAMLTIVESPVPTPSETSVEGEDGGAATPVTKTTSSSCTAVVVVGLAEQMTLVRTQRLVRKGVLTFERASHLFMPEVLSYLEPAWFCGPCGMLVGPTEIRNGNRLKVDSKTPKLVCPHCNSQRVGRKGSHVWTPTFPEVPRRGQRSKVEEALSSKGGISVGPAFVTPGEDFTGHNLPDATLISMKLSVGAAHPGDWVCKKCSWYNFRDQTKCRRCQGGRAISVLTLMVDGGKLGDWVCGNCMRVNYHKLDTCFSCYPPLGDRQQVEEGGVEPSMMKGSDAPCGAGIRDVDAGSAFLTRSEMDKVQSLDFMAKEEEGEGVAKEEGVVTSDSTSTTSSPNKKPYTGTRSRALIIFGEDLTPEVVKKHLPSPPSEASPTAFFPSAADLVENLEVVNSVIVEVYSKMGVCPSCNYRHHFLDVLPGSRCRECKTELTVKLYPFVEGPPFSSSSPSTSEDKKPSTIIDSSSTGEAAEDVSSTGNDEEVPSSSIVRRYIKTCRTCNTENHISRDLCRRCGVHVQGWKCEADAVDDEDGLFEDDVEPPSPATDGGDDDRGKKRICGHLNSDEKAYCSKCGAYAPNAVMPSLEHDKFRRSFGSRLHAQTHQSGDWLSRDSHKRDDKASTN